METSLIIQKQSSNSQPFISFFKPSQLRAYTPPDGHLLLGNNHLARGDVAAIGGEPGSGKSTAAFELAFCGATARPWLGLPVHTRFRTLIIQSENSRARLKQDFLARNAGNEIEDMIMVSEPPPYGLPLADQRFQAEIEAELTRFAPDLVILDPWNGVAKDSGAAEYSQTFELLRAILAKAPVKPALLIVAHTRKPRPQEKRMGGTGLMHMLAGSYILTSVPRSIFILIKANPLDETDNTVVVFNPKNNNGEKAERSAWVCNPAGYEPLPDFNWDAFDGSNSSRKTIEFDDIEESLGEGLTERSLAITALIEMTGLGRRACEKALAENGRFANRLYFEGNQIGIGERTNENP